MRYTLYWENSRTVPGRNRGLRIPCVFQQFGKANKPRARFAERIRITRFGEFVLYGKLDGDYAPHTRRFHFLIILQNHPERKMFYGSLCRSAGLELCPPPAEMKKFQTAKNGKTAQYWYIFPWWYTHKIQFSLTRVWGASSPSRLPKSPQNAKCGKCGLQANLALLFKSPCSSMNLMKPVSR